MKHLKLFFALFAMLALGVGNAWGAEATVYTSNVELSTTNGTKATASKAKISTVDYSAMKLGSSGNAGSFYVNLPANTTTLTLHAAAWNGKNSNKLTLSSETAGVTISPSTAQTLTANSGVSGSSTTYTITPNNTKEFFTFTLTGATSGAKIKLACTERCLIWGVNAETAGGGETPDPTTYTIKWHTAKGVTTDVTLNEGAPITKPATDPTMSGYVFMGWTEDCEVASDGAGFTAIENFGTATEDKAFYAVFAKATTTGGGAATETTASVVIKDYASAKSWANSTKYTSVDVDANITATVTGGTNTGKYYTSGNEWRLYQTESAKLTISAKNDLNIKTVKVTYNVSSSGVLKLNNTNVTSGTVKDVNASSITFSVGNSGSATNGQVKVTAMEVVYTSGGGGTTTYDNYITTCASGIEYVELGDDFKWSAAEAEVTIDATDNVFPTLTNTRNVPVTYSSSDDAIASIVDGAVTLKKEGTVTITAKYAGGTSAGTDKEYKAKTVTYSLKVNKAAPIASGTTYVKVTSTEGVTNGEYLIVYEEGKVAFNGALNTLDAVSNTIEVEITDGKIAGTNYIDDAVFTIDATEKTIKSASGKYIGRTAYDNGLDSKTEVLTNTITISEGNAVITASGNCVLRYNKTSGQDRFRYFKSGQEPIALYKKASEHIVTIATCTNGSVEASVANDAKVLSGTTITLSNTPATNYKLTAYDVYKTGEETTKVTVTDGKFIMPEFDVTISATFEQLKELDKIEVNTTNVKTTFWQGEAFNSTGLVVTAYYTDETSTIVIPKSITGSTAEAGTKQVTVSYTEGEITKETKYDITVKAIANNEETPYTVTVAREIIDAVGETTVDVYVQGIVSKIVTAYNSEYGNISYNISEDGKTTSAQLQAYRGKSYNGDNFTSADDIQVDDKVVVKGTLKKHDTTYEFAKDNQLVSLVRSTEPKPTAATLPFEFDGNKDDIADVVGMSQTGLGTYDSSPKLKFDDKNDNVIIHFDSEPGEFSFLLKQNGSNVGIFTVYESENGEDYTSIWSGGDLGGTGKSATIKPTISATSRYVKFEYTTKPSGTNYGLGQISIKKIDKRQEAGLAWNPATVSLTVDDAFTAPTFSNPNSVTGITFTSDNETLATVDNAGVISLVSGKTGTATITATFADGHADYKPAKATCVITVSPKSEKVVILAQLEGQWYAMTGAYVSGKTNVLSAIPVEYINGTLYNVSEADKASIEWQRSMNGNKAIFKNGDNYLTGDTDTDLTLKTTEFEWDYNGVNYLCNDGKRTFLYCENTKTNVFGFKNYAISNAGSVKSNSDGTTESYSSTPVVTTPIYKTATFYTRSELTVGNYGTICLPYAVNNFTGATFYKVAGKEGKKIIFDEVTELEAGKPYIFMAEAAEIKLAQVGDEYTGNAQLYNSLQGTFTQIKDAEAGAAGNILEGNYMVVNNVIKMCGANCGLKANRAYFVATELEDLEAPQSQMPGRRRISLNVTSENTTTGLDNITNGKNTTIKVIENGQLIIIRNGEKFNAQGVRL